MVQTAKGETLISSDLVASRICRGPTLKVIERKDPSTNRKGGRISDRGDKSPSRSKSRTFSPKRLLNLNCEVPNSVSRFDSLLSNNLSCPNGQFKHSTETEGDRICRWSSGVAQMVQSFNAVLHNAPIDDNAKMSHLKTPIKTATYQPYQLMPIKTATSKAG